MVGSTLHIVHGMVEAEAPLEPPVGGPRDWPGTIENEALKPQ
jgi:hypothetical protein